MHHRGRPQKKQSMAWLFLFLAGLTEVGWAIALKYSHGFTRLFPSIVTIVVMIASFFLLAQSLKSIPIGTAYAIWTGIGILGTVILGIFLFNEPRERFTYSFSELYCDWYRRPKTNPIMEIKMFPSMRRHLQQLSENRAIDILKKNNQCCPCDQR